uniref:Uncharacterized protein n=1 Tax=Avena sativa TaxID=4498 RepID=A0ACD5X1N2_AVESA
MLQRVWKRFTGRAVGEWSEELKFVDQNCTHQGHSNNLCGYYVCEFIRNTICVTGQAALEQLRIERMRDQLLPFDRIRAFQEELAGFILDELEFGAPFYFFFTWAYSLTWKNNRSELGVMIGDDQRVG